MKTLNEVYTALSVKRRYEVWFLRVGLADGSGALWVRYLLLNPGRAGCLAKLGVQPVQVWATWFARGERTTSLIEGYVLGALELSERGRSPMRFSIGPRVEQQGGTTQQAAGTNAIGEGWCRGSVRGHVLGHEEEISWNLRYRSSSRVTLSSKGWIGFSRTPHLDAVFHGEILVGGKKFGGEAFATGVQGHNSGQRHRKFWTWMHANFGDGVVADANGTGTAFEALCYEMPLGLVFRKAVLWREGKMRVFRGLQESVRSRTDGKWVFEAADAEGTRIEVEAGGESAGIHRIEYVKTDCSGTFEVANNSLTRARIRVWEAGGQAWELQTEGGAVVEMAGDQG